MIFLQKMKMFNLKNFILLTIFCLPSYLIKGPFFNLLDVLMIVTIIGWLFSRPKLINFFLAFWSLHKKVFLAFSLVILGISVATLKGGNISVGLGVLKSWFILPFVFSLVALSVFAEQKEKKKLLGAYFWSAFFVSCLSLIFWTQGKVTYDFRLMGIFNSPNYLAMYIAPAFLLGTVFFMTSYTRASLKNKLINLLLIITMLFVIYLTKSYASWLAIGASLLIVVLIVYKNKIKIFVASLILIISGLFFCSSLNLSSKDIFSERSSLNSRIIIWKSSEKIIKDNWLWGIGPSNFQNKYLEYQKYFPPYLEWAVPHPHNLYLGFWLSGGIFSLAGFIYLIFLGLQAFARSKKKSSLVGALVILLYLLLHGVLDTTYFKNDLAIVFWLSYLYLYLL